MQKLFSILAGAILTVGAASIVNKTFAVHGGGGMSHGGGGAHAGAAHIGGAHAAAGAAGHGAARGGFNRGYYNRGGGWGWGGPVVGVDVVDEVPVGPDVCYDDYGRPYPCDQVPVPVVVEPAVGIGIGTGFGGGWGGRGGGYRGYRHR